MKRIVIPYLLVLALGYTALGLATLYGRIWLPTDAAKLFLFCGVFGGLGGTIYCLRGVYLNACVHKTWSRDWLPWYLIRPLVSFGCGIISCLFLKAGLVVLEAKQPESSSNIAFYALAFIAGLNVDKFLEKLEDIAQVTWGIKKSRASVKESEIGKDK